ncbi:MAG: glycosyltransferase [Bacteroidales bacterium]
MLFSFIIPVFNRPQEVDELLESLTKLDTSLFEVIIVEDGSSILCQNVVERYKDSIDIKYYFKKNTGPGDSRNYGANRSTGEYIIVLDSDVVLPEQYLNEVQMEISKGNCEAFGGPDRADDNFSSVQKAINYAMTSFFTTGGIRGGKKKLDRFYPRSYNMGIKRDVWIELGGFSQMRFGEDIDFSLRLFKAGYNIKLFTKAWVFHKRRVDLKKFYRQVYNFGIARIDLEIRHPKSMKLVHTLPALFTLSTIGLLILGFIYPITWTPLIIFSLIIAIDSSIKNRSLIVGVISIVTSYVQLYGYGLGFLDSFWKRVILKGESFTAFQKTFYK